MNPFKRNNDMRYILYLTPIFFLLCCSKKEEDASNNISVENNSTEKHRSFYSSENGKILLRLVAKRLLGQEAAERKKQGFSAPDASWFKGESIDLVKRKVLNPTSPLYGFVDYKTAVSLVEEHLSGKRNRRLLIWSLLNLDEFCGQYLT